MISKELYKIYHGFLVIHVGRKTFASSYSKILRCVQLFSLKLECFFKSICAYEGLANHKSLYSIEDTLPYILHAKGSSYGLIVS